MDVQFVATVVILSRRNPLFKSGRSFASLQAVVHSSADSFLQIPTMDVDRAVLHEVVTRHLLIVFESQGRR